MGRKPAKKAELSPKGKREPLKNLARLGKAMDKAHGRGALEPKCWKKIARQKARRGMTEPLRSSCVVESPHLWKLIDSARMLD